MKILKKIIMIILIIMIFGVSSTYADDSSADPIGDIISDGDKFLGQDQTSIINQEDLEPLSNDIFNALFSIGLVVAVIVGLIMGIQYMMSSIEEKAKGRQTLIAYFIGCIVLFGAFGIWRIIVNIFNNLHSFGD